MNDRANALIKSMRILDDDFVTLNDEFKLYNSSKRSYIYFLLIGLEK